MDCDKIRAWLADSFRLRPFLIGVGIGLAIVPILKAVGWIF